MHEDATKHVESCITCAERGVPNVKYGALEPIQVNERFHTWAIDFAGEWTTSDSGNKHLFVAVDLCTKIVELHPTKACTAKEAADALARTVIANYGAPAKLVSDRGSVFTSALMGELCDVVGTAHSFSVAHHPESHGQVENTIKTVERMLQAHVSEHQRDWDDKLWLVKCALRHTPHRTTGVTPFMMLTGEDAKLPVDRVLQSAQTDLARAVQADLKGLAQSVKHATAEVLKEANEHAAAEKAKQKKHYDQRHRPPGPELDVGKFVLLERTAGLPGTSRKLSKPYIALYKVVEAPSALNRKIQNHYNADDVKTVNVSQLKPFKGDPPSKPVDADRFYVEEILQEREGQSGPEYLVRWSGYGAAFDTWEPEEHIDTSGDVFQRFKQRNEEARKQQAIKKRNSKREKTKTDKKKKAKGKRKPAEEKENDTDSELEEEEEAVGKVPQPQRHSERLKRGI